MKKTVMRQYARLLARTGVNIQKGQPVVVSAEADQFEFVNILVDECYKAGAGEVEVQWDYQPLSKLHVRHQHLKTLSTLKDWQVEKLKYRVKALPAAIYIESADPDGLRGIDQRKLSKAMQARYKITKPFRDEMDNKFQWCIAAVPGKEWAKKLFPNDRVSVAVEKLWDAILTTARAKGDAVKNWEEHNAELAARCAYLNALDLRKLHYRSGNGTDFSVGLLPKVKFLAGAEHTKGGVVYNPNIPSEEVFTSPDKDVADGVVVSTKPLSYRGEIIDNFKIWFEGGKAVRCEAEKNGALLETILHTDETSCKLGEAALVPFDSPISNSGLLFCNTLFDENAACHLALGHGFNECIEGYENMTDDECTAYGVNDSYIHVDFMIGSADLDITGTTADGKTVPIFRSGNWAFDVK